MPKCPEGQVFDKKIGECRDKKSVGRPSTKKKCPEGQVYDKELKDCRDKIVMGRPRGKSNTTLNKKSKTSPKSKNAKRKSRKAMDEDSETEEEGEWMSGSDTESEEEENSPSPDRVLLLKKILKIENRFKKLFRYAKKKLGHRESDVTGIVGSISKTVHYINDTYNSIAE
jgi:hypothetical protein